MNSTADTQFDEPTNRKRYNHSRHNYILGSSYHGSSDGERVMKIVWFARIVGRNVRRLEKFTGLIKRTTISVTKMIGYD